MKINVVLLSLLTAFAAGNAIAQWQWLDKDGRKVFSDRAPPPEIPEKSILKRPFAAARKEASGEGTAAPDRRAANAAAGNAAAPFAPAGASSAATKPKESAVDKELTAKKQQAADAEAAKRKAEEERVAKSKAESCARAKQSQAELASGGRMSRLNAKGEREVMDETARDVEMKYVQSIIDSNCK